MRDRRILLALSHLLGGLICVLLGAWAMVVMVRSVSMVSGMYALAFCAVGLGFCLKALRVLSHLR